jgi:hypothetical protein
MVSGQQGRREDAVQIVAQAGGGLDQGGDLIGCDLAGLQRGAQRLGPTRGGFRYGAQQQPACARAGDETGERVSGQAGWSDGEQREQSQRRGDQPERSSQKQ